MNYLTEGLLDVDFAVIKGINRTRQIFTLLHGQLGENELSLWNLLGGIAVLIVAAYVMRNFKKHLC